MKKKVLCLSIILLLGVGVYFVVQLKNARTNFVSDDITISEYTRKQLAEETEVKEEAKVKEETEEDISKENTDILNEQVSSEELSFMQSQSYSWYTEDDTELDSMVLFEEFDKMEYALFLETNVGYPETYIVPMYGVYGDFMETVGDGVGTYVELNKRMVGIEIPVETIMDPDNWLRYKEEHIVNMSSDMEWMVSRQFDYQSSYYWYLEKWYRNKNLVKEIESDCDRDIGQFVLSSTDSETQEPLSEQKFEQVQNLLNDSFSGMISERYNMWFCFDEFGKLLAVREKENKDAHLFDIYQKECIRIYDISGERVEKIYEFSVPETEVNWTVEISQIVGDEKSGWLVFSAGPTTYRMQYPNGDLEKIGEFMYNTTYSPDEKYRAYCTGNIDIFESWEVMSQETVADEKLMEKYWELRNRWDDIPAGWYVEELETGNKSYIPVKTYISSRHHILPPICYGRSIWIEKGKLLDMLDGIGQLSHLKHLQISVNDNETDLSPLGNLSELESLDITISCLCPPDLSFMQNLTKLEELSVTVGGEADLSPIGSLTGLKRLTLYAYGDAPSDLAFLKNLKELTEVFIDKWCDIEDLSYFRDMPRLQSLSVSFVGDVDLYCLSELKNLETLQITGAHIRNLDGLGNSLNLKHLSLSDNSSDAMYGETESMNLQSLTNLTRLEWIDLEYILINDITPLASLKGLRHIYLANTKVEDILPIADLEGLDELYLFGNYSELIKKQAETYFSKLKKVIITEQNPPGF